MPHAPGHLQQSRFLAAKGQYVRAHVPVQGSLPRRSGLRSGLTQPAPPEQDEAPPSPSCGPARYQRQNHQRACELQALCMGAQCGSRESDQATASRRSCFVPGPSSTAGTPTACSRRNWKKMAFKRRVKIEDSVRQGLQNNQFALHYQPLISQPRANASASRRCSGSTTARASRFHRANSFRLRIEEKAGLIQQIGEWVIETM